MRRTMESADLDRLLSIESVRRSLGVDGELSAEGIVSNPANIVFSNGRCVAIFCRLEPGRYEVHSMADPHGDAVSASRSALRKMFLYTDCMEVVTKVPTGNLGALGLVRLNGFGATFDRPDGKYYTLGFDKWRAIDPEIGDAGAEFHARLAAVKAERECELVAHEHDADHNRAAGAAFLMAIGGNPDKAVWTYNRWAAMAGYAPLALLSRVPVVIDLSDAVVEIIGSSYEVLKCR